MIKVYVTDSRGDKIYIRTSAKTKTELKYNLCGDNIEVRSCQYNIDEDVFAEYTSRTWIVGMIAGAVIGMIGAIYGSLAGAGLGWVLGYSEDMKNQHAVKVFNEDFGEKK